MISLHASGVSRMSSREIDVLVTPNPLPPDQTGESDSSNEVTQLQRAPCLGVQEYEWVEEVVPVMDEREYSRRRQRRPG